MADGTFAAPHADPYALVVDLDGWEGPLDLLLALARAQKVDLKALSITRLADQFLAFIRAARRIDLELAADYLVMAAWLAWLKSKLLLPRGAPQGQPQAAEGARLLAQRLARLAAIREAARALAERPLLGQIVFTRGDPDCVAVLPRLRLEGSLSELMAAYVSQRRAQSRRAWRPGPASTYPLDDARARLRKLLPELNRWTALANIAPSTQRPEAPSRASFVASTLCASLELVREGDLEARQRAAFAELYLRARPAAKAAA